MDIAIIGAGFSGTMLAYHLLRDRTFLGNITWWEKRAVRGQGIAYGTHAAAHVLNVAAQNMSALPDAPQHLLEWLQEQQPQVDISILRDTYVPRRDYARYLQATTAQTFAEAGRRLVRIDDEATDVEQIGSGKQRVYSAKAAPIEVDRIALCTGHFAPRLPRVTGAEHLLRGKFIANPWDNEAIANIGPKAVVASLGAGLTMVDLALQLEAQGFQGQLVAVSRHGLWPRSHVTKPSPITLQPPPINALGCAGLVHWVREQARAQVNKGGDWRQIVDALRPHTVPLWRALGPEGQARLLRHGKTLWDAHRHRVAPHVGQLLAKMRHDGTLVHHAGRLDHVSPAKADGKLQLTWKLRGTGELWPQTADVLINCTGAHNDWTRTDAPLARALLQRKRAVPGPHGVGLHLADDGALLNGNGGEDPTLFAMGPARLGLDFESVAVPELRRQALALAQRLMLKSHE